MPRLFQITCLCVAVFLSMTPISTLAEDRIAAKTEAATDIVVSEPDEHGLVTKLRPVLPKVTTGDPLRFALHFETKDGPVDHSHEKLGQQLLDRAATLNTFEVAIRTPGEKWQVLKGKIDGENPRKTMLYSNATFLLEVREDGLASLNMNGQEELLLPWEWKNPAVTGEYSVAVRGTLKLSTNKRVVRERGKPDKEFPATETEVDFRSKPINIKVARADMTEQSIEDLSKQAVEALKKHKSIADESLTVVGVDGLPIADSDGNRVIRVKATIPAPKPAAGGGAILLLPGGRGYWQYEVTMSPAGMPVSFARARKGFCVARGTMISTPEDNVSVEHLHSGQQVWAYDLESGTRVHATVQAVFPSNVEETVTINGTLRVTPEHPVLVLGTRGPRWKVAALLRKGETLLSFAGRPVKVTSIEIDASTSEVFDVAVDGPHNFFAAGLLVHNKSIAWSPQAFVPWYALWNRAPALK